jgi:hypothetical protein
MGGCQVADGQYNVAISQVITEIKHQYIIRPRISGGNKIVHFKSKTTFTTIHQYSRMVGKRNKGKF